MAKSDKNDPILVGIDDGFACTNLVGNDQELVIRTTIRQGMHGVGNMDGMGSADGAFMVDGNMYTIGDDMDGENTRFDSYPGSALNRVAIHQALLRAGLGGKDVVIATGLPVTSFYDHTGTINMEGVEKKRELLKGKVETVSGEPTANIIDNVVCSEAVAAFLDYVLDMDGNQIKDRATKGFVGVVDIGGRTTDCAWICPPNRIDHSHSGTINLGVLDVMDMVNAEMNKVMPIGRCSRPTLERAIRNREWRPCNINRDEAINAIVDNALNVISERISREIERQFGIGAELEKIIFVGGGAALMPQVAAKFPHAFVPEKPEFANARGMYKFLKMSRKAKG